MSNRVNHFQTVPNLTKPLLATALAVGKTSLDPLIKCLIDIRASQLNGCAFCLDMHVKEAKIQGERELRLYHVAIWRESPLFSDKEKAALTLTEALTKIGPEGIADELYEYVSEHFTEVELAEISFAIAMINTWNRLEIFSRATPGIRDEEYGLTKAGLS